MLALLLIAVVFKGGKIIPQSEQHVVEHFGRLRAVLGTGINLIVPFFDKIAHEVSILERQLPTASQDAIKTNVVGSVENWRIEVTRAEILDVNLDSATRAAMMQQLNAERARRLLCDAEAYTTQIVAVTNNEN